MTGVFELPAMVAGMRVLIAVDGNGEAVGIATACCQQSYECACRCLQKRLNERSGSPLALVKD